MLEELLAKKASGWEIFEIEEFIKLAREILKNILGKFKGVLALTSFTNNPKLIKNIPMTLQL